MPYVLSALVCLFMCFYTSAQYNAKKILVFSKVNRYFHESIPSGISALQSIGKNAGMTVDTTTDATWFTEERLKQYAAVVFLNTSGDNLLDTSQKADFERYIQAGGGFMGIHGAAATEYGWPWYGRLVGAVFAGHPEPQPATVMVADKKHASTRFLPRRWKRFDEWYNFKTPVADRRILLRLNEKSYKGGNHGADHPIAWYHEHDGGRSFYTGLGHTSEAYSDPLFLRHLAAGISYVAGGGPLNYSGVKTKRIPRAVARILVFSKTRGWKHSSIPFGIAAVTKIADNSKYIVDTTTSAAFFTDDSLGKYHAIIFNNTSGNVFSAPQQAAFERYIQAGGGFVGIHAAADTEHDWPWYGNLVGGHFLSHPSNPNVREAVLKISDTSHPATSGLPLYWKRNDEWYNYKSLYPGIRVLATVDEESYQGGTHGAAHPIVWYHEYDGGRAFYTGGGHTDESFSDSLFIKHLEGGIRYAVGHAQPLNYSKSYSVTAPDHGRFKKTVLTGNMDSPMELAVSDDGRIFYTELSGKLSVFDTRINKGGLVHKFNGPEIRGLGLIGVTLDPAFNKNGFIYLYYAPGGYLEDSLRFRLSRFAISHDNKLDLRSEKILLSVPVQSNGGAHYGGSLAWDKHGNLYLSTGDGTSPFPSDGYAPLDERKGKEYYSLDAQRSAGNTNSLQGKILRIRPQPDGTYAIPDGNLFKPGTPLTRPEIFVMGVRNPYRIAVHPQSSVLYWGDIGPDAGTDSHRGPRGYDEFNQAKEAGNFGWPYFIANNKAYSDWNFSTNEAGKHFVPGTPVNNSPNNTGIKELPPARPSMIWYPYAASAEFPQVGEGGRCIIGGDFYTYDSSSSSSNRFPRYYHGQLFIADWMRNWVMTIRMDSSEDKFRLEPFMPASGDFRRPIDMAFGKDGLLYMLEYGSVYGAANEDARLVQIGYTYGNRPPVARASIIDRTLEDSIYRTSFLTSEPAMRLKPVREISGQAPLRVAFSSAGSFDADEDDNITCAWHFGDGDSTAAKTATHLFTSEGTYRVVLFVRDAEGLLSTDSILVRVGNTRPQVLIVSANNTSFADDGDVFKYSVEIKDNEDTLVDRKRIKTFYLYNPIPGAAGFDFREINYPGRALVAQSDCKSCHLPDKKAVGPSYIDIAKRYQKKNGAVSQLAAKIIKGGGGNWGASVMSAHPQVSRGQAQQMVEYIFSLTDAKPAQRAIPATGSLPIRFKKSEPRGTHHILAVYTDKGGKKVGPLTDTALISIRNSVVQTAFTDEQTGFQRFGDNLAAGSHKNMVVLKQVDLSHVAGFTFSYSADSLDSYIEVRMDSRAGPKISSAVCDATGNWKTKREATARLDKAISGRHDLYFIVKRKYPPFNSFIDFDNIRFLLK